MKKIRASQLAKEFGKTREEVVELAKEKLSTSMYKPFGPDIWIDPEGVAVVEKALEDPEPVAKHLRGFVLRIAPNPRFAYCKLEETEEVVPVLIPRKMGRILKRKRITIEAIEDADGITYRRVPVPGVG